MGIAPKLAMHPGLFAPLLRLPKQVLGRALSTGPKAPSVAAPTGNSSQAFDQILAESMLTRQPRPQALPGRRQEFPRFRALRQVGDAQLSRMLLRTSLGRGPGGSRSILSGKVSSSHPGEAERYFRAGASRGGASSGNPSAYDRIIKDASQRYQVPEGLIKAVIKTESNFNPRATSPKGAMGLMQLMPGTARDLGVSQAYNPEQNIDGGTRYLRDLLDRYKGNVPKALAAYNWGPGNLEKGRSLPRETRNYLETVGRLFPTRQASQPGIRRNTPANSRPRPANLEGGIDT